MDVIGFPNYLIYPDGRVWSKHKGGRWRKYGRDKDGYLQVSFCEGGKSTTRKMHRLIAIHYIPNPKNKPTVDHINRIKTDNRIENLRWATHEEQSSNKSDYVRKNNNHLRKYPNKHGHRGISRNKYAYSYTKKINGQFVARREFKKKSDCLCYKFITMLKIRAGLI